MENIFVNKSRIYPLQLISINKDEMAHELVSKVNKKITLISELKTYFLYLEDKKNLTKNCLREIFVELSSNNYLQQNLDIDVNSFTNENINESEALQIICEALFFGSHQPYSLQQSKKFESYNYNLVTSSQFPKYTSFEQIKIQANAINLTRNLQDLPPNLLYAEKFAEEIKNAANGVENLKVTILDKKAIAELEMNLLLAVNAGSYQEPRVVVLEYKGDQNNKEVIGIVGKGITFDSGGYSLKPSNAMIGMKFDMSGAAIVCNSAIAAAKLKVKSNFIAVACLTDNRIGSHATLVESVIKSMSGITVEINNTDAEGRLVLADGITYAIRQGNATKIIDVATLTGAILIALGNKITGAFASDNNLYNNFAIAADQAHEEIWRLPIHKSNIDNMKSSVIADISNISKEPAAGGSSNGAAFLLAFAENKPLLHLDIASTATNSKKRGTAVMIKTIVQYLKNTNC